MVVHTAVLEGLEARIVDVEAKATGGLGLRIEGPEMQKARALEKRVLHATTSCGMGIEGVSCRVVVQESGLTQMAGTTLAVAAACLAASGEISAGELSHCLFVGDVDEGGNVHAVPGTLAHIELARRLALTLVTGRDAGLLPAPWSCVRQIGSLDELRGSLHPTPLGECRVSVPRTVACDFAELRGLEAAKHALVVSVCGSHPLLLAHMHEGSVRAFAKRCATVLPPPSRRLWREMERIHSAANTGLCGMAVGKRPVRVCAADIGVPELFGDGETTRPGEVSLAHGGVLVLTDVERLRERVAARLVRVCSSGASVISGPRARLSFPARFLLICVVGKGRGPARGHLPAPLDVLIDLVCDAAREDEAACTPRLSSKEMAESIVAGLVFRARRRRRAWEDAGAGASVGEVPDAFLHPSKGEYADATLRVARTLADLGGSLRVRESHLRDAAALVSGGDA